MCDYFVGSMETRVEEADEVDAEQAQSPLAGKLIEWKQPKN